MTIEEAQQSIEKEFAKAGQARKEDNEGMVRVCARRAAGAAITFWLQRSERENWGVDAMSQLRHLQLDESMPQEVREAATRLTTKITQHFTSPFTTNPIEDSTIIIRHLLG